MNQSTWTAVDTYFEKAFIPQDEVLEAALTASDVADLPQINVAPNQGKLLMLLAKSMNAQHILEVGTLGGYSTIWLARALGPDGRIITLEMDPKHAEVAQNNIAHAGFADQVDVRIGVAVETLQAMTTEDLLPFDFVFIDADKENNTNYFNYALHMSRPGTVIIMDNVVRQGKVIDADHPDSRVKGVRAFVERVANEPRVIATALQTVGDKGYDGFAMLLVVE